jgi:hypothetical protein
MTIDEIVAWLNRLQNRIAALASNSQVQTLLASVESYKSATNDRLNLHEGRLDSLSTVASDHELRIQALEDA